GQAYRPPPGPAAASKRAVAPIVPSGVLIPAHRSPPRRRPADTGRSRTVHSPALEETSSGCRPEIMIVTTSRLLVLLDPLKTGPPTPSEFPPASPQTKANPPPGAKARLASRGSTD